MHACIYAFSTKFKALCFRIISHVPVLQTDTSEMHYANIHIHAFMLASIHTYMHIYIQTFYIHTVSFCVLDVSLSSDFIAGFCGETESDHQQTVELLRKVKYQFAFCFPYSMRQVCGHLL